MIFAVRLVTWFLLVAIFAMTLGPVSLRPHTHFSPDLDRFAAYAVLGVFFALSYPRRRFLLLAGFLAAAAGALETAQLFVPGRDAHLSDFLFKAGGATTGLIVVRIACFVILSRYPASSLANIIESDRVAARDEWRL
jgi:VanZ family protein